jgi:hypothetical protein
MQEQKNNLHDFPYDTAVMFSPTARVSPDEPNCRNQSGISRTTSSVHPEVQEPAFQADRLNHFNHQVPAFGV